MNIGIWEESDFPPEIMRRQCEQDPLVEMPKITKNLRFSTKGITEEILCRYALFCVEKPEDKNDITAFLAWCLERDERVNNET